jgi:hypothetical protein
MACLGATLYDPAVSVAKSCAAALAMTAIDTTNLRVSFTVPSNGSVFVRLKGVIHGTTSCSQILLGVLEGSTVRGRAAPMAGRNATGVATGHLGVEALFVVTGLTPGAALTWDAAYGVEFVVASSDLKYGGPDNATTNDSFGAFSFEVWETANMIAGKLYDPSTAVAKSAATLIAMTAIDTTNLRHTFTVPPSGQVYVRLRCANDGSTLAPALMLGVLEGSTVRGRVNPQGGPTDISNPLATSRFVWQAEFVVPGLTPGASLSWDAAYGVDIAVASSNINYGGPNDTTASNAWGGFAYEVWAA